METTLRVAAYVRVSSAFERQQNSFANQIRIYRSSIQAHPDWQLVGIYADEARSGTTDNRPGFRRLLRDCRKKKIDMVIVKSISRFARNTLIAIENVRMLQNLGIPILFEKENIDTSKPYSEMLLTILAAFAQEESRNISERMKKGLQMRAQNGAVRWIRTYGYRKGPDGKPVTEPEEAAIVKQIFYRYEHGESLKQIRQSLNEDNIPSAKGKCWSDTTVRDILCNPRYVGDILTNKYYTQDHLTHKVKRNRGEVERIRVADHHEAIIDRKTFERVQIIRKLKNREQGATVQYPFGDRLRCPWCNNPLRQRKSRVSHGGSLWICEGNSHSCGQFAFRSSLLEKTAVKAYETAKRQFHGKPFSTAAQTAPPVTTAEYWWIDELIDRIEFGCHETETDRSITVFWKNGKSTTLPSGAIKKNNLPHNIIGREYGKEDPRAN